MDSAITVLVVLLIASAILNISLAATFRDMIYASRLAKDRIEEMDDIEREKRMLEYRLAELKRIIRELVDEE